MGSRVGSERSKPGADENDEKKLGLDRTWSNDELYFGIVELYGLQISEHKVPELDTFDRSEKTVADTPWNGAEADHDDKRQSLGAHNMAKRFPLVILFEQAQEK